MPIQQVGVEAVESAAAEWARMTSVNTANKTLTTLTAIFKLAQRYGPIQGRANVAELAERLKVSNEENEDEEVRPEQVYSEEELQKLVAATAPGSVERVPVMVPALTGFRIGEVLGLTWPAVDFKANKIHIRLNLVDDPKKKAVGSFARLNRRAVGRLWTYRKNWRMNSSSGRSNARTVNRTWYSRR